MADFTLSDLTTYSTTSSSDLVLVEDDSATDGTYYKATPSQLVAARTLSATGNGTSGTMYVDVSGLPAGDLEITFSGRGDTLARSTNTFLRFGTTSPTLDSGSNYTSAVIATTPDTAAVLSASDGDAVTNIVVGKVTSANATANQACGGRITVFDFSDTTFYKTCEGQTYLDANDASRVNGDLIQFRVGGQWRNTAAIGVVGLVLSAGNWVTGSVMRVRVK